MTGRPQIVPYYVPPIQCSHRCAYCHPVVGVAYERECYSSPSRLRTLLDVRLRRIRDRVRKEGVELFLCGGPLGMPRGAWSRVLEAASGYLERGEARSLRVSARPDQLWPVTLRQLVHAGVETVELDVSSMVGTVLAQMGPAHAPEIAADAADQLRAAGMRVGIQVRLGLPGSRRDGELRAFQRILDLRPDFVRIYPELVIRGTWLEQMFRRGQYVPMSLEEAKRVCFALLEMSSETDIPVARLGWQPMRDFQLGPGCVVGGPYHPSLRTLVESERMLARAVRMVRGCLCPGQRIVLEVAPGSVHHLRGPENRNLDHLRRMSTGAALEVRTTDGLEAGQLRVSCERIETVSPGPSGRSSGAPGAVLSEVVRGASR